MFLTEKGGVSHVPGFPRVSGDVSCESRTAITSTMFSPRERGCFSCFRNALCEERVFPA